MELLSSPASDEFELTLLGPGYGESAVLHIGDGSWIVVDSCLDTDRKTPAALAYLRGIGADPEEGVKLIVATHWHDDHIQGISRLVEECKQAAFCCPVALRKKEFLKVVEALAGREVSALGSGVDELHAVFSRIKLGTWNPLFALANRRILKRDLCEVYSLSPDDQSVAEFLASVGSLVPTVGESIRRAPQRSPNAVSVVLWVSAGDIAVLLGADMERRGWVEIVQNQQRPNGTASVFKVAHHGSENAHEPGIWKDMLADSPYALLAPWSRGGKVLPKEPT